MMIDPDTVPAAGDPPEYHADFLELSVLKSADRSIFIHAYIRDLRLSSADEAAADAEEETDPESDGRTDYSEPLAESAFDELDDRVRACGNNADCYPFEITANCVALHENAEKSLYTFLALLSWFGKDKGPPGTNGVKLFEEVCARVAAAYLGWPNPHIDWFVFGFPRQHTTPRGFKDALDALCTKLGEGQGHHTGRLKMPDEKDGKLDIVAWRDFPDRREGKLINFGQCATGRNWMGKVVELPQAVDWCTMWMANRPGVWPIRSFFVPHRVDMTNWFDTCVKGGILYDRCRIASFATVLDPALKAECEAWSQHVLQQIRGN
jgi:hypothetical protein